MVNENLIRIYFNELFGWDQINVFGFDLEVDQCYPDFDSKECILVRMSFGKEEYHLRHIRKDMWDIWYLSYRDRLIDSIIKGI